MQSAAFSALEFTKLKAPVILSQAPVSLGNSTFRQSWYVDEILLNQTISAIFNQNYAKDQLYNTSGCGGGQVVNILA